MAFVSKAREEFVGPYILARVGLSMAITVADVAQCYLFGCLAIWRLLQSPVCLGVCDTLLQECHCSCRLLWFLPKCFQRSLPCSNTFQCATSCSLPGLFSDFLDHDLKQGGVKTSSLVLQWLSPSYPETLSQMQYTEGCLSFLCSHVDQKERDKS